MISEFNDLFFLKCCVILLSQLSGILNKLHIVASGIFNIGSRKQLKKWIS